MADVSGTKEDCGSNDSVQRANAPRWISKELTLCSGFLGCSGLKDMDMETLKEMNDHHDLGNEGTQANEDLSVKTSDVTVPRRGSSRKKHTKTRRGSKYEKDSNTVAAVAPLLQRAGSYEFERRDADHFVRGKTFVFYHQDFCK